MGVEENIVIGPKGKKSKREKREAEGGKEISRGGNVVVQDSKTIMGKEGVTEKEEGDANKKMKKARKRVNLDIGDGNIKEEKELDYGRSSSQDCDREVMEDADRKKKKKKNKRDEKGKKKGSSGVSGGSLVENEGDAWLVDNEMHDTDREVRSLSQDCDREVMEDADRKKKKKKNKREEKRSLGVSGGSLVENEGDAWLVDNEMHDTDQQVRSLSQDCDREVTEDADRKKKKKKNKREEKGKKKGSLGVTGGSLVENEGDACLVDNEMHDTDGEKYGNKAKLLEKHGVAEKVEKRMKKEKKRHKDDVNSKAVDTPGEVIKEKIVDGAERKKRKREKELAKGDLEAVEITGEGCDGEVMEKSERKKKKREKRKSMDDLGAREASGEGKLCSNDNGMQDHNTEDNRKGKRKNANLENNGSDNPKSKRRKKKVSFSNEVEVFPLSTDSNCHKSENGDNKLVRGKRFSPEEDKILKEAVYNYIEERSLGEEGLNMVLNVKSHPEIKDCWKHIAQAIPYRPKTAIYYRAQVLFRRGDTRKWTEEDYELIRKYQEEHGNQWKALAEELGKHRVHVKDTWRRIKCVNRKKGHWSQEEYQSLFDLVNTDLILKISESEEKKTKHGMLRDNIHWSAISDKLSTRSDASCCLKWYDQLTSPMVAEGLWADADDYRLIKVLFTVDASCIEDVDWDNLLDHRSGDVCRKRWSQMVLHVGQHGSKSFAEQVEILAKRYCPDLVEVREAWDSKPVTG